MNCRGEYRAVFGEVQPKELKGFPDGEIEIKMGKGEFVKAYVNTSEGTQSFYIKQKDGYWMPLHEQERNEIL